MGCEQAEEAGAGDVSPPDLQLVSAGNAPRKVIRYDVAAGTARRLGLSIAVELGAGEMGGPMPTLLVDLTLRVDAVLPTGQMMLRTTIDGVVAQAVPDSKVSAAAVAGPLQQLEGLAITSLLAPNGRLTGSRLYRGDKKLPPELDQQINSLIANLESTVMPLPDEAIGAGAVWRSSRQLRNNGLELTAVSSVSLVKLGGNLIEYTLDSDIHGPDQSVKQDELVIEVKDIIGNGVGKGTIDLATLGITSELGANLRSEMSAAGDEVATKMEMATLVRVRPL
jgi:hypothetical protein